MEIRHLSDGFAVSGQIAPADLPEIARLGFKTIICNRPDGEGAGQPSFQAVADRAQELGLATAYVPVAPTGVTFEDRQSFAETLRRSPQPVLAYCRSGNRSATLWQSLDPADRQAS